MHVREVVRREGERDCRGATGEDGNSVTTPDDEALELISATHLSL